MTNPIPESMRVGAMGELLTQVRLLQLGVEAFRPLVDSGTDLVAFRHHVMRTLQVKARADVDPIDLGDMNRDFDALVVVLLAPGAVADEGHLDSCSLFLVPRDAAKRRYRRDQLDPFALSHEGVGMLFA